MRELQIKARRFYYILISMTQSDRPTASTSDVEQRSSHCLLAGMHNVTATLESLADSYNAKYRFTMDFSNHTCRCLHKWIEKLRPHKNPHTNVYISFIYNCQKSEAIQVPLNR